MSKDLFKLNVARVFADTLQKVYSVSPVSPVLLGARLNPDTTSITEPLNHYIFFQTGEDVVDPFYMGIRELITKNDTDYAGDKDSIHKISISSVTKLINEWSKMGTKEIQTWHKLWTKSEKVPIGIVVVAVHGEPGALRVFYPTEKELRLMVRDAITKLYSTLEEEGETYGKGADPKGNEFIRFSIDKFDQLESKEIKTLLVASCHSGNIEIGANGVAPKLVNNNSVKEAALGVAGIHNLFAVYNSTQIASRYSTKLDPEFPDVKHHEYIRYPDGVATPTGKTLLRNFRELIDLAHDA